MTAGLLRRIGWSFRHGFGAPSLLFSLFWHQIVLLTSGALWRAMFLEKINNQEREEKRQHKQRHSANLRGGGEGTLGPEMVKPGPDNVA